MHWENSFGAGEMRIWNGVVKYIDDASGHYSGATGFKLEKFESARNARSMVFEYIEGFYNLHRLHSSLQYMSPHEYEKKVA